MSTNSSENSGGDSSWEKLDATSNDNLSQGESVPNEKRTDSMQEKHGEATCSTKEDSLVAAEEVGAQLTAEWLEIVFPVKNFLLIFNIFPNQTNSSESEQAASSDASVKATAKVDSKKWAAGLLLAVAAWWLVKRMCPWPSIWGSGEVQEQKWFGSIESKGILNC